ncbi:MAG: hypothetical protein JRJ15_11485 [Deltaproteobacteria bacterium]|nr:hypothetical protein [Deltaproteobacteria bacterium]
MGSLNQRKRLKYFFTGLIWLVLISSVQGASPEKIKSELVQARENLHISETTADKIAAELEELRTSGQASPEIIDDYEFYLTRVQAMVDENRKVLKEMEAAYAGYLPLKQPASKDATKDLEDMLNPNIPEEQTVDEVAVLDQEFNDSLAEFDSMLLQEFDAIRARSAEKMRDLAGEAAEAAERLREKGIELSETEKEPPSAAEEGVADGEKKVDKGATDKERDDSSREVTLDKEGNSRDRPGEGGQGPSREQNRTYDKEDDDIVARQLREAAENETDPELKEKLWKEYEEYKKNTR